MNNLKAVAAATKNATYKNSIPLYYDIRTDSVFTDRMLTDEQQEDFFFCTKLIRECTEKEIQSYVYRFLWM